MDPSEFYQPARFGVSEQKLQDLCERMLQWDIDEDDLVETFVRGGGPGGQKINKGNNCVQLLHKPTGIRVRCQRTRSLSRNRYYARKTLVDRVEKLKTGEVAAEKERIEKIRRQKRRRTRRAKERILKEKKLRSQKKELRRPPQGEE